MGLKDIFSFGDLKRDVTEANLQSVAEREWVVDIFSNTLDASPNSLIILDSNQEIIYHNSKLSSIFHFTPEESEKLIFLDLFNDSSINKIKNNLSISIKNRKAITLNLEANIHIINSFQRMIPVEVSFSPIQTQFQILTLVSITDMSDYSNAQKELKELNKELESIVYSASHDLKAPLNNIRSLSQLSLSSIEEKNYDELSHMQNLINGNAASMIHLIKSITNLVRQDGETVFKEEIHISDILSTIKSDLSSQISEHNIKIEYRDSSKHTLIFYKHTVQQVLSNLISNGIKYHDPQKSQPFIKIHSYLTNHTYIIEVEDNGLGIPQQFHNKIFNMFYRAHTHKDSSGLGLYLTKRNLEKVGGRITFDSEENIGTTFKVCIPI